VTKLPELSPRIQNVEIYFLTNELSSSSGTQSKDVGAPKKGMTAFLGMWFPKIMLYGSKAAFSTSWSSNLQPQIIHVFLKIMRRLFGKRE